VTTADLSLLVSQAAQLLRSADHAIALTGAGISTPSGIPDFRSSGSGLWNLYDAMEVASLQSFRHNPRKFFEWSRPLTKKIFEAKPNAAHIALAELEKKKVLMGIITQNIDNLHHRAGSASVVEIHGHLREATCVLCFQKTAATPFITDFIETGRIPTCNSCGGILKPDTILFGEQLPYEAVSQAQAMIAACDLIFVIGSSLEVHPVARFPVEALNRGAHLIIVNQDPTYLDSRADVLIHDELVEIVPRIASEVLDERDG
jgi:NAD-dependent deacetylase